VEVGTSGVGWGAILVSRRKVCSVVRFSMWPHAERVRGRGAGPDSLCWLSAMPARARAETREDKCGLRLRCRARSTTRTEPRPRTSACGMCRFSRLCCMLC